MRSRLALWVLLASALTFLTSLYLPWKETRAHAGGSLSLGLFVFNGENITGLASGIGDAAALAAVALVAATLAGLARPRLADRLPLAACALLTAYFGVAVAALLREQYALWTHGSLSYPWAYGAYLGIAACAVAVVAAAAFGGRAVLPRSAIEALGWAVAIGLLVSLLLPWHRLAYNLSHGATYTTLGLPVPSAVLAAALVMLGGTRTRGQALCWVGAGILTFGAFGFGVASGAGARAYGFWLALGFALALLAAGSVALREWPRPARPESMDALLVSAAAVFVVSLFLPWQRVCFPESRCIAEHGWTLPGSSAAVLAGVVAVAVLLRSHVNRIVELAAAMGLLVATAGFTMDVAGPGISQQFAYGSILGFAATALLMALAAARSGRPELDRRRVPARVVPIAASIALIAGVVLPWWSVLPTDWALEDTVLRGWFAVAGLVLSVHLLWCWLRRTRGSSRVRWELALVPVALLSFVALALIAERDTGMTWGGGILAALCLLLTALGWIEAREGLENLAVPELLRVDRLPDPET